MTQDQLASLRKYSYYERVDTTGMTQSSLVASPKERSLQLPTHSVGVATAPHPHAFVGSG